MIVVVGLGNIGLAIARRLVVRGHSVTGVEVAEPRRAVWQALTGQTAVADLDEVDWAEVDRVFVIVRMTDQAGEVLTKLPTTDQEIVCHLVTTLEPLFASRLVEFSRAGLRIIEPDAMQVERGAGNLREPLGCAAHHDKNSARQK